MTLTPQTVAALRKSARALAKQVDGARTRAARVERLMIGARHKLVEAEQLAEKDFGPLSPDRHAVTATISALDQAWALLKSAGGPGSRGTLGR